MFEERIRRSGRWSRLAGVSALIAACSFAAACGGSSSAATNGGSGGGACTPATSPVITLAAYSNPYDAYGKLTSAFACRLEGQARRPDLIFQMSFGGSTTQAQNIVNGFQADVVRVVPGPDVEPGAEGRADHPRLEGRPNGSIVATSVVGFMVRPGNPKGIHNWNDLTQPGLQILTPDPAQSGGARWNIVGAYGAAMRGKVPGYRRTSRPAPRRYSRASSRTSPCSTRARTTRSRTSSRATATSPSPTRTRPLAGIAAGSKDQFVIPPSTVADPDADGRGRQERREALRRARSPTRSSSTCHTPDAQAVFAVGRATSGRSTSPRPPRATATEYPPVKDLFTTDDLGGWDKIDSDTVFGPNGAFTQAFKAAKG